MEPATTSPLGPKRRSDPGRAFTLLEVTLALALLAMLVGISVYGLTGWQRTAALNEGHRQFATMLRAARIEASAVGKQLRVSFTGTDDDEGASFEVLWENDPFDAAGTFVPYGKFDPTRVPDHLVRVRRCRLTGDSAYRTLVFSSGEGDADVQDMTFYPDGSCDSAQVVLVSTTARDRRGVVIELSGITGTMTAHVMGEDEFADWLTESE